MISKRSSKKSRSLGSHRNNLSKNFQRRASFEPLESRQLLAVTLAPISPQTVLTGAPLNLALDSSGTTNPVSYTVNVNNSTVAATLPSGNSFLKLTVDDNANNIHGDMVFQLFNDLVPTTVQAITNLVNRDFYDGLTFHRIISNFMIQGGDPNGDGTGGPSKRTDNSFNTNLQFTGPGLLAMANSGPDTDGSQFFITAAPYRSGDFKYTIIGRLVSGDDIRQQIAGVPVHDNTQGENSVPDNPVTITNASMLTTSQDVVLRLSAPQGGATGTSVVTVTAKDTVTNETSIQTINVTVAADTNNDPPFLNPVSPIRTALNTPVTIQLTSTDVEGDAVNYEGVVSPANPKLTLSVNNTTGSVTITPAADLAAGTYTVLLGVNNGSSAFDTQLVQVVVGNIAPVLTQAIPGSVHGPIIGYTSPTDPFTISISSFINHGAGTTKITDSNAGAILGGIALSFTNVLGSGTWQYSVDGGATFDPMVVSDASAILLPHDALLRYTPGGTETGTVFAAYRAWDMSSGAPGDHIDLSQKDQNQNVIGTGGDYSVGVDGDNVRIIINNAPVLTAGHPNIGPVQEDNAIVFDFSNPAFLNTLLNNGAGTSIITDANQDPYAGGIAITGFAGDGKWEYSARNNAPFEQVDLINTAHALLLATTGSKLRYTPNANSNAPATFTYVAWDKSTGISGDLVDLSQAGSTGGATPFSSTSDTATVNITAVNDAPVLSQANPVMGAVESNASFEKSLDGTFINNGAGTTTINDIDTNAIRGGIAVIAIAGSGTWEYSTDGGANYHTISPSIDDATALLLSKDAKLKYTPGSGNSAQPTITYLAWDTTSGEEGDVVNLSQSGSLGGATAFSLLADTAKIVVNNAPVLVPANSSLGSTDEDTSQVYDLASFINSSAGTTITDDDEGAEVGGIALIGAAGNGTWAYLLDGETTFINVGAIGPTAALLLPKTAKLRYTPDGKNGETTSPSITYHAWDKTSGEDGDKVDLSEDDAVGGASAFSELTDTAELTVTDVNDAPVVTPANPIAGITTHATPKTFNLSDIIGAGKTVVADVDTGAVIGGIALVGVEGSGTWEYSLDGGTNFVEIATASEASALLLPQNAKLRYTPGSSADSETATIEYRAWDATTGTAGSEVDLSAANSTGGTTPYSFTADTASVVVNDAPVLTSATPSLGIVGNTSPTIIDLDETLINHGDGSTIISDPNPNDTPGGIALIGATGSGTWAYSLDGGTTFVSCGTIGPNAALLLPKNAKLRFTPTTGTSGPATIVYRAWDTTTGDAGEKVDLSAESSRGEATAYSTASDTATLTVRSAPTDITLSNSSIPDNSLIGSTVGTLSATPEGGTFTYELVSVTPPLSIDNEGSFTLSGNTIKTVGKFNAGNNSSYSIRVKVTDQLGLTFEKSLTITITDVTQPTVEINQQDGQPDPTHTGSIYYVVEFSEPVTGFTAADITLTGTAVGTSTVVKKILGSGKNYEVQVSGMTGSGTVTATIAANTVKDSADYSNLASTSDDNTVSYIKEWAVYGGTNKDDSIIFSPGTTAGTWQIKVNSTIWALPTGTKGITIDGLSGNDSVRIVSNIANQNLQLGPNGSSLMLGNFQVNFANMENFTLGNLVCTIATTSQSKPTIYLFGAAGSPGTKTFTASPTSAVLSLAGNSLTAAGFADVQAYIQPGNGDTATFTDYSPTDSSSNDLFLVSPAGSYMKFTGARTTEISAWGFSRVNATSSSGTDEARFYGKSGATDTFVVSPVDATYTNSAFINKASGFDNVQAYIDPSNNSTATLIGTSGKDRLVTSPYGAQLFGPENDFFLSSAWNFKHIIAQGEGNDDTANMYGSSAADTFTGLIDSASFSGANFDRQALNFSKVTAHGKAEDEAIFRDTATSRMGFAGTPTEATMSGSNFLNIAQGFGRVQAFAAAGNNTSAAFTDSATKKDIYTASSLGAQMKGSGYEYAAWGFSESSATSTGGGDIAYLFGDSSGDNQLLADSQSARLSNTGFDNTAKNFAEVRAFGNLVGNDIATLVDADLVDNGSFTHKLTLNDFDELFTKETPSSASVAHAIDEVMMAYWP